MFGYQACHVCAQLEHVFLSHVHAKMKRTVNLSRSLDISFSCVCPVIDHKFRHHMVKVAVDPRGVSRVDLQTTLTML